MNYLNICSKKIIVQMKKLLNAHPGLVVSIDVDEGQEVDIGDKLCTIEAMKMENVIRSEVSGIIKKFTAVMAIV